MRKVEWKSNKKQILDVRKYLFENSNYIEQVLIKLLG